MSQGKRYWPWILTVMGMQSIVSYGANFDPPDLQLEAKMHRQFLTKAPQGQSNLNENYQIQKGDTLWTLSEMLYGDGKYWPHVWAQRQEINRSHLVRPGHALELRLGNEDETPQFRFSEEGESKAGVGLELVANNSSSLVEIPPPDIVPRPVIKVPASFPAWQSVYAHRSGEVIDDRALGKTAALPVERRWVSAYVQEGPLKPLGKYMETAVEAGLPMVNQHVYLNLGAGLGQIGSHMLVVKDLGPIQRMNRQWKPTSDVHLIQIVAEVEITDKVAEGYRAIVTRTLGLSAKDCDVIAGEIQSVSLEKKGPRGAAAAQVIGSEKDPSSELFGPGEIVFLNKGSADGVEKGQWLNVFSDRTIRNPNAEVKYPLHPTGVIKVVRVDKSVSTAVVLSSSSGIQQGDITR